jgi:ribonuclease P protein component
MAVGRMDIITSSVQISDVFNLGTRFSSGNVRLMIRKQDPQRGLSGRVAFIAGKKLGNAVVRNRSKRVMREAARATGLPVEGYDILLMATPRTRTSSQEELCASMARLLQKAGLR